MKIYAYHRGFYGYLLSLLLQCQSPSLKDPCKKGEKVPKQKKLTLARTEITLQETEMPSQSKHRKLKVLEMPSEFEIVFLLSFLKMQDFVFLFFFFFFFCKLCC
uniref:Uncharacterized protein n=1 Tax=Neovison vison TaxID=452646 RepID=A0A8C7C2Z4_NEOVI